ncbi:chromosome partitioning protein [Amycolatopsis sp. WAC 04169]|uniref:chromosome partitioning protein n=1 Tax=Amycolatopsis sp. WAC 04169 TaxID=2203197 RepID=UPI000F79518E|nr:chromosome partitioning protein [Amycolatopsis sp. WAC 04169]RSN31365.1 chromosome partitioning protein [Amycolatopsis sp. WAC 04169]
MGLEVVVGFLIAWAVGKARRAGQQLDGVADQVVDASAARLRDVVLRKLGADSAFERLRLEAGQPEGVSERTTQRVTLALEDAAEQDADFATDLKAALAEAERSGAIASVGGTVVSGPVTASGHGIAIGSVGGNANVWQPPGPHNPERA